MDDFVWIDSPVRCTAPAWAREQFLARTPDPPCPSVRCGAARWAQREYHAHQQATEVVRRLLRRQLARRPPFAGHRGHSAAPPAPRR
jgi:hypothetical protein